MNQSQWDEILKPEFKKIERQQVLNSLFGQVAGIVEECMEEGEAKRTQGYYENGLVTIEERDRLLDKIVEKPTLDTECPNWWD